MPSRFTAQRSLPPYTYVPGQAPHPLSDAAGHSFGKHAPSTSPVDNHNWRQHEAYLYGVDLFNQGYYWEAHESWEAAWNGVGRRGVVADFLKGLIHLAAAGVKLREGRPTGTARHLHKAEALFQAAKAEHKTCLGVSVESLLQAMEPAVRATPAVCSDPPTIVRPLFVFAIEPDRGP